MRNSEAFLSIFADVEKWLRRTAGADRAVSFYQLVEQAATAAASVRLYKNDLKEYADLRNAIAHERTDGHVIAEPNERALRDFERIRAALLQPPKVLPQFQRQVMSRLEDEPVGRAVADMRKGAFSQLPIIRRGTVVALLTSETVVRWLASEVANDLVSLMDTPISAVLPHVEDGEHYCFLRRTASLHEALSEFESFATRGKDLDAILLTEAGRPDQKLLGILTVFDLPAVLDRLGLRRFSTS